MDGIWEGFGWRFFVDVPGILHAFLRFSYLGVGDLGLLYEGVAGWSRYLEDLESFWDWTSEVECCISMRAQSVLHDRFVEDSDQI
jgi:hypothetical protein